MTAGDQNAAVGAAERARQARVAQQRAERYSRNETIRFIDLALAARWTWDRIGDELEVSGTAARRFYARNRRFVRAADVAP